MSQVIMFSDAYTYHLYNGDVDMRRSFDGLCYLVRDRLDMAVNGKNVFIFFNKRRTHVKVLLYEDNGFSLFYRRLTEGQFSLPDPEANEVSIKLKATQLLALLKCLTPGRFKQVPAYQHLRLNC
jgi:hypothetical protein